MIVGIVGSEAAKFTSLGQDRACAIILNLLAPRRGVTGYSSGHCHLGGIDIWTEEIGDKLGLQRYVFEPRFHDWTEYKKRNLKIAETSDEVYCISVDKYPPNFSGMRFDLCYHCGTKDHIKSGGCWTMKHAIKLGKQGKLYIVQNYSGDKNANRTL